MQMVRLKPAPPLDRYIDCLWWSRREGAQAHSEHMLPSGTAQLVLALHEAPLECRSVKSNTSVIWTGGIVHGPQSSYYLAGPKPKGAVVGVSFRPGAAGALLGVPMNELLDRHVTLDSIWGRRGASLHDELGAQTDPIEILRILEEHLNARIHRPLLMHPAVARALATRAQDASLPRRMSDLQRDSGYSARHFIALFRAAVGLAPKHYYRIRRFNRALRDLAGEDRETLGEVAASLGYSDQAHLTREFRELAGVAPSQYQPSASDRPLHHRAGLIARRLR